MWTDRSGPLQLKAGDVLSIVSTKGFQAVEHKSKRCECDQYIKVFHLYDSVIRGTCIHPMSRKPAATVLGRM